MESYFAQLSTIPDKSEIPMKISLPTKLRSIMPDKLLTWYINKYNPLAIEESEKWWGKGFNVGLPLFDDLDIDKDTVLSRTAAALKDMGVEVLACPGFEDSFVKYSFFMPTGESIFPCFLKDAIFHALKKRGISLKRAQFSIIGDDNRLTDEILNKIYPEVNYLSLVLEKGQDNLFHQWAEKIFSETGLVLTLNSMSDADVVINLTPGRCFDYHYKKGAIYAEPPTNSGRFTQLLIKREDLLAFNGLELDVEGNKLNLAQYETLLYLNNTSFKRYIRKSTGPILEPKLEEEIKKTASFACITRNGKRL